MNAEYVKAMAQTGDVLAVHGDTLEQRGIQIATCSPFCHVALLVRAGSALVVCEMLEPDGYRSITFEDWLAERAGQKVFFGQAPDMVRQGAKAISARLIKYESPEARQYAFTALPLVWLSDMTGREYETGGEVCSLLVGNEWESAGYPVPGNPSPGDFLYLCDSMSPLR